MPDDRERIDLLREELDVGLQASEQARAQLGPVSASDATGSITVQLDEEGQITQIHTQGNWRQQLDPDALPAAVLEAYSKALSARELAYFTAVGDAEHGRARPANVPQARALTQLNDEVRERGSELPRSMMLALSEMLDDLNRGFDEAFGMLERQLTSTSKGRSSSGHAFAEVSGDGQLVSVSYDQRWLGGAHPFNVGRETTEAVHDARRQQAAHSVEAITQASGLGRLRDLINDPEALKRHLGL